MINVHQEVTVAELSKFSWMGKTPCMQPLLYNHGSLGNTEAAEGKNGLLGADFSPSSIGLC